MKKLVKKRCINLGENRIYQMKNMNGSVARKKPSTNACLPTM